MKAGKIILWSLIGATAVVGGVMLYRRYGKTKKNGNTSTTPGSGTPTTTTSTTTTTGGSTPPPPVDTNFPLAFGSRGSLVTQLQKALMVLYPNSLPKYGADGVWGKETETALKSNNLPTTIKKPDFDRIVGAATSGKPITQTSSGGGIATWF
jgi:hypothetical protein